VKEIDKKLKKFILSCDWIERHSAREKFHQPLELIVFDILYLFIKSFNWFV